MLIYVAMDVTLEEVIPSRGKGALGHDVYELKCPGTPDLEPDWSLLDINVQSGVSNQPGDGCTLVRALACACSGRITGKSTKRATACEAMAANRSLGNPTDRAETGGLWNRVCHGNRTEVRRETGGTNHRTLQQTRATLLSQPEELTISPESCATVPRGRSGTWSAGHEGRARRSEHALTEVNRCQGQPEAAVTDSPAVLRTHSTDQGGESQGSREGRPRYPLEGRGKQMDGAIR